MGTNGLAQIEPSNLVSEFKRHLKDCGKKKATIESYCRDVLFFLEFLAETRYQLKDVDENILRYYQEDVKRTDQHGKQNSIRRSIIAIRQFFRFLSNEINLSPVDEYPIPARFEHRAPKMSTQDLELLLQQAKKANPIKAERDQAILCLLGYEGIKVSELIELEWSDFLYQKGRGTLFIRGERARVVHLSPMTATTLLQYRKRLSEEKNPTLHHAKLLIGFTGKDYLALQAKVSRHGLKFMLYELGSACKLPSLNSEKLRHHSVSYLLRQGHSPEDVMKHLGLKRLGNICKHLKANL